MEAVTGFILAGGKSRRFGRNKAFAPLQGKPLIEHVIAKMKRLFAEILLIANTPEDYESLGLEIKADIIKGLGPLGGIYTALFNLKRPFAFFAACDMPFLKKELIEAIVARRRNYDIVVPRVDDKIEPLHACYSKDCLPRVREIIEKKEFKIDRFYEKVKVYYMEEEELRRFDPALTSFRNINTQKDLKDCTPRE